MVDDSQNEKRGFYGCATWTPFGFGGGLCADLDGNIYPQLAIGTPGFPSVSAGYASDLTGYLTGPSVSANIGGRHISYM